MCRDDRHHPFSPVCGRTVPRSSATFFWSSTRASARARPGPCCAAHLPLQGCDLCGGPTELDRKQGSLSETLLGSRYAASS